MHGITVQFSVLTMSMSKEALAREPFLQLVKVCMISSYVLSDGRSTIRVFVPTEPNQCASGIAMCTELVSSSNRWSKFFNTSVSDSTYTSFANCTRRKTVSCAQAGDGQWEQSECESLTSDTKHT